MAANLTPQYHDAEDKYRAASTLEEKLAALEEMWRELPKHKSTEKLQAELKRKLSSTRKEIQAGGKKGATKVDPFAIPKSGGGQVVLIGAPNVGKSSIVGTLTNAHVTIADYPYSTPLPLPGMVAYEDIRIQLVDTPPISADHLPPGFAGLWWATDAVIIVADLSSDDLLEDVEMCFNHLAERRVELTAGDRERPNEPGGVLRLPGMIFATKSDTPPAADNLELLREFFGQRARIEAFSIHDEQRLAEIPRVLFNLVHVVRVYAKPPGRKADLDEPFVLHAGSDIHDLARQVYRGLEEKIHSARLWGEGVADGQNVHLDHVLHDRDVVELHA